MSGHLMPPSGKAMTGEIIRDGGVEHVGVLGTILGCRSFDQVLSHISAPVATEIGADHYIFFRYERLSKSDAFVSERFFRQADSDVYDSYCSRFYDLDPLLQPYMDWFNTSPRSCEQARVQNLADIPDSHVAEFRSFLHSHGLDHDAGFGIPMLIGDVPQVFCLGFQRAMGAAPFSSRETARLNSLLPAVRCVLEGIAAREALSLSSIVLEAVTQVGDGCGYVILDGDLIIRDANEIGLRHLGLCTGRADGDLWARNSELLGVVRQFIMSLTEGDDKSSTPVTLCFEAGTAGSVSIQVKSVLLASREPHWLLIATAHGSSRRLASLRDRYRLSEREAEVVHLLGTGDSNSDIGRMLQISTRTVENHLRSIYAKCGIHTRAQMISKLMDA